MNNEGDKMEKTGDNKVTASSLEKMDFSEDGVRLVSTTFGITLYTDTLFSEIPEVILYCYDKYLNLCSKENLKFYATENMKRHKPVTDRVFGMLQTWMKPGAPPREYISLVLKDGSVYQDAPKYKFDITGNEKESTGFAIKNANLISFSFPPSRGVDEPEKMLDFVRDLCDRFPFQSGHAGFSFECCKYEEETSQTYAWQKSMHHPGIDVSRIPEDNKSTGQDALKTVNWLTLLNMDFIGKLGGIEAVKSQLSEKVDLIKVQNGYILKSGRYPAIGDRNRGDSLPLYQSVYRLVEPLVEIACDRSMAFDLDGDFVEKTEQWYRRFKNE